MNNKIEDIACYAEKALYYTCPYCGTKSLISEAKIVEQNIIIPISLINKENLFKYDEDRWQ